MREQREGERAEVAPVAPGHLALFPREVVSQCPQCPASSSLPPPTFPPSSSLTSFFAFAECSPLLVTVFGAGNEHIGGDNRDGPYSERTHSLG